MKARVTMRDVAREANVSPMTVSRALKDDSSVNAKTRALVRNIADRLGYIHDTTAQAFRTQRSGFLAVTMPSINNANFAATHRALRQSISGIDLQILLGVTDYRLMEEERLVRQLLARRPDVLVLTGGTHTDPTRSLIQSAEIPVIEMWDLPAHPLGHAVGFSNKEAMRLIVEHLAQTGRRKLAFLGAFEESDRRGAERWRGVDEAARDFGLPDVVRIDAGVAPVSMRHGAEAVRTAGSKIAAFDGLMCVSDPVAFGALSQLQAQGVRVPDDIAVTGFGAFEISQVSTPTITTVDVGAERIGSEVGRIVAASMGGTTGVPGDEVATRLDTHPQLVIGATT